MASDGHRWQAVYRSGKRPTTGEAACDIGGGIATEAEYVDDSDHFEVGCRGRGRDSRRAHGLPSDRHEGHHQSTRTNAKRMPSAISVVSTPAGARREPL